jgi:hypothetical protein
MQLFPTLSPWKTNKPAGARGQLRRLLMRGRMRTLSRMRTLLRKM